MIAIVKATNDKQFKAIALLANSIWREHYTKIIGKSQVDYMLEKFQSAKAIKQQTLEGYTYYILTFKTTAIGYLSIKKENHNLFLSKLYVLQSERGKGFGKMAMKFIEAQAKTRNCRSISLTVNKNNSTSINAYKKLGFKNLSAVVIAIGNGFIMDDFKMQKDLD